jgi:hypothetical protein
MIGYPSVMIAGSGSGLSAEAAKFAGETFHTSSNVHFHLMGGVVQGGGFKLYAFWRALQALS